MTLLELTGTGLVFSGGGLDFQSDNPGGLLGGADFGENIITMDCSTTTSFEGSCGFYYGAVTFTSTFTITDANTRFITAPVTFTEFMNSYQDFFDGQQHIPGDLLAKVERERYGNSLVCS